MVMFTASVEFTFDAAHRLFYYEGPCKNLHGHTYTVIVTVAASELSQSGFVMDFRDIKRYVKSWVDSNWDHKTILSMKDPLVGVLRDSDIAVYVLDSDPTAERMAELLYDMIYPYFTASRRVKLQTVAIKETPTSAATYTR